MFGKNKNISSGVRKVDKIVTGVIIGSAIASIFGLSQTKKGKQITTDVKEKITPKVRSTSSKIIRTFGRILAFLVSLFSKKK